MKIRTRLHEYLFSMCSSARVVFVHIDTTIVLVKRGSNDGITLYGHVLFLDSIGGSAKGQQTCKFFLSCESFFFYQTLNSDTSV